MSGKEKELEEQRFDKIKQKDISGTQREYMRTPANSKAKDEGQVTHVTGWVGDAPTKVLLELEAQHLCLRLDFVPASRQLWPA